MEEEEEIFEQLILDGAKPQQARERAKAIITKKIEKVKQGVVIDPAEEEFELSEHFKLLASQMKAIN